MNWAQLLSIFGGGVASGVVLRQLLSFWRYVLKHRALTAVINREGTTPEHWQAAADALATIDASPGVRRPELPPRRVRRQGRAVPLDDSPNIPNQRTR